MSNERSPRFPAENLTESVEKLELLYKEVGRSAVDSDTAARSIGYSGLNGASKTTLAALNYYGLIQREGHTHKVSDLGFKIIRPLNDKDKLEAMRTAAFSPKVFAEILEKHPDCSESVLSRVLMHTGFSEEGAERAARVFKENSALFGDAPHRSGDSSDADPEHGESSRKGGELLVQAKPPVGTLTPTPSGRPTGHALPFVGEMLAQYQIPLGANQAHLAFTGEELTPADFDDLIEYVRLFKKQFERKLGIKSPASSAAQPERPRETTDAET